MQTGPPPKCRKYRIENIEIPRMAVGPIRHPRGCIGASNGASTAFKLEGKPEIHVFFVRLYTLTYDTVYVSYVQYTVRIIRGPVNYVLRGKFVNFVTVCIICTYGTVYDTYCITYHLSSYHTTSPILYVPGYPGTVPGYHLMHYPGTVLYTVRVVQYSMISTVRYELD